MADDKIEGSEDAKWTARRLPDCEASGVVTPEVTYTAVRSPDRSSHASATASRRSVFTLLPGRRGNRDGATTSHAQPFPDRYRVHIQPDVGRCRLRHG